MGYWLHDLDVGKLSVKCDRKGQSRYPHPTWITSELGKHSTLNRSLHKIQTFPVLNWSLVQRKPSRLQTDDDFETKDCGFVGVSESVSTYNPFKGSAQVEPDIDTRGGRQIRFINREHIFRCSRPRYRECVDQSKILTCPGLV